MKQQMPVFDDMTALALTKNGEHELREAGTALSRPQLEVLVLIDTPVYATVAQMIQRARNLTPEALRTILRELIDKGLVKIVTGTKSDALDPGDFFSLSAPRISASDAGAQQNERADADAEILRQKGYCVNFARKPAEKRKIEGGRKPAVLVIDDDPDICNVLQLYLRLEGFDPRIASTREEIVAAMRQPPLPDLVLLDVVLGKDLNGFDVLAKMRQHPILKNLPVIMLTAEATREAVLKGILGGADGYVTKPFSVHPLVRAVRTVLGLDVDSKTQDWDYSI